MVAVVEWRVGGAAAARSIGRTVGGVRGGEETGAGGARRWPAGPADCDRGDGASRSISPEAADCRSKLDALRAASPSILRVYSLARSKTPERDDCVDLYDVCDFASTLS